MEIDAFGDVWCGCAWEMVTDQMVGELGPSLRWDDGCRLMEVATM